MRDSIRVGCYYSIRYLLFVYLRAFWYIVRGQKQPKYILIINKTAFIHISRTNRVRHKK